MMLVLVTALGRWTVWIRRGNWCERGGGASIKGKPLYPYNSPGRGLPWRVVEESAVERLDSGG